MTAKLELYRIFCQVAKSMSFSKAARILYMSQPAVSQAVKQLEEQLRTQLFTRSSKGVMLTAQGQILYEHASAAISLINSAEQKLLGMNELTFGELRIGAGDVTIKHLLLSSLEQFHKEYPKVKLSILNRTSRESIELLQSGKIDVAFVNLPIEGENIHIHHTFTVHDVFVAGKRFEYLKNEALSLEELAELPLIMLERKSNTRTYIEKFFLDNGVAISPEIALASYDLLLEFARIDLGISCVIREFARSSLESGALFEVPMKEPIPERSIAMVSLKNVSLTPAASQLLEIINQDN